MKKTTLKSLDIDVINFILHNNDATIDELCNCFDVSPVNIRTVLAKIENFVSDNNLGKLLKSSGHYFFENNSIKLDFDYTEFLSEDIEKKERITYIVLKLILENSINLTNISRELNVSRITLNADLEFVKELIQDFNLSLVSVQWRGVFLEGELLQLQKFSILFLSKLYIEEYFRLSLKNIVNPILLKYFREIISEDLEKKSFVIADKLYQYFGIKLGIYHYYILVSIILYIYVCRKNNFELYSDFQDLPETLYETLEEILDSEDKNIIGEEYHIIIAYLSNCIHKKYSIPISKNVTQALEELYKFLQDEKLNGSPELLSFFINNLYFENRFFIPTYIKIGKDDEKVIESEICKNLIDIFIRNNIPYNKKDLAFLYNYFYSASIEIKKKSVLIIDSSTLTWKAEKLKEKLKYSEKVSSISIVSYFNFKLFPIETYKKYEVFIFIDLPTEKKNNYSNKNVYFINSFELLKNSINFNELLTT